MCIGALMLIKHQSEAIAIWIQIMRITQFFFFYLVLEYFLKKNAVNLSKQMNVSRFSIHLLTLTQWKKNQYSKFLCSMLKFNCTTYFNGTLFSKNLISEIFNVCGQFKQKKKNISLIVCILPWRTANFQLTGMASRTTLCLLNAAGPNVTRCVYVMVENDRWRPL